MDVAYGSARLGPNHTVIFTPREVSSSEQVLTSKKILIATRSRPFRSENITFDDPDIFDSEGLSKLDRVPKNVLIVGCGSIGCEFASIFTAFGLPVTLVHSGEHILRSMDKEMSCRLYNVFKT